MSLTIGLCGCGNKQTNPSENSPEITTDEAFPKTLQDQMGRIVTIEKEPESIVSGYYISTSALIALGQDEKLVGIENDADKRSVYSLSNPAIVKLPSLGTVKEFDLEECMTLNPDLVVIPTKLAGIIPTLEELGITVIVVNPENEVLQNEMIELLGDATGSEEIAQSINRYKNDQMAIIKKLIENEEKPRVYLAGNHSILSTSGPQMYQHCLIENAGGSNVALELSDTYWAEVSYEQLLTWNPEYIIIAADANYDVEDVLENKNIASCDAIKNKKVYKIPNVTEPLDSPVPGSFLGTLYIANILHPEQYEESSFEDTFKEFYEKYYHFTIELD